MSLLKKTSSTFSRKSTQNTQSYQVVDKFMFLEFEDEGASYILQHPKKRKQLKRTLTVLSVIAILLAGALAYYFLVPKLANNNIQAPEETAISQKSLNQPIPLNELKDGFKSVEFMSALMTDLSIKKKIAKLTKMAKIHAAAISHKEAKKAQKADHGAGAGPKKTDKTTGKGKAGSKAKVVVYGVTLLRFDCQNKKGKECDLKKDKTHPLNFEQNDQIEIFYKIKKGKSGKDVLDGVPTIGIFRAKAPSNGITAILDDSEGRLDTYKSGKKQSMGYCLLSRSKTVKSDKDCAQLDLANQGITDEIRPGIVLDMISIYAIYEDGKLIYSGQIDKNLLKAAVNGEGTTKVDTTKNRL